VRLGQLARQLEIKTEKIISFLEKDKNIIIKTHPNSKIEDNLIDGIIAHFTPLKEIAETIENEVVKEKKTAKEVKKVEVVEQEKIVIEHIETPSSNITGPKIIGKIDLPDKSTIQVEVDGVVYDQEFLDKKKKEDQQAERERRALEKEIKSNEEQEKKRIALEKRNIEAERQAMLENEKHNILTAEEERKKAIIEKAIREREEKLEEKRKQRQKQFYKQQVVAVEKKKPKKLKSIENNTIVEEKIKEEIVIKETNLLKRFIKWLNT